MQFLSGNPRNGLSADSMCIMAIRIVKFPREGCKIRKIFGLQHTYEFIFFVDTVFPHIVSAETILFWIWKPKGHST